MAKIDRFNGAPDLTPEQAAIIGAYTGILCGDFATLHELVECLLKRHVWTHEMGIPDVVDRIKAAAKPLFLRICCKVDEKEVGDD